MEGMKIMLGVMLLGILVATLWGAIPAIKETAHAILDPTLGVLLNWNTTLGFILIAMSLTLLTTVLQKYMTDQVEIKRLKDEQKVMQEDMKKHKDNPQKMMEIQQEMLQLTFGKMMTLTMRPLIYTAIPFVLLMRWFTDYFTLNQVKVLGMGWIWAYLIISIIFSSIFRKLFKVH